MKKETAVGITKLVIAWIVIVLIATLGAWYDSTQQHNPSGRRNSTTATDAARTYKQTTGDGTTPW